MGCGNILDNSLLMDEILLGRLFKSKGLMLVKVHMDEAYGRLRWDYLEEVLDHFYFSSGWLLWITTCIINTPFAVLVNGYLLNGFIQRILVPVLGPVPDWACMVGVSVSGPALALVGMVRYWCRIVPYRVSVRWVC